MIDTHNAKHPLKRICGDGALDAAKARMADGVPMKRLGADEDSGPVCGFSRSLRAGYMTGQDVPVDCSLVCGLL